MLDTDRITAAFRLAADVHRTQTRKGTDIPYIAHPMAVASQVLLWGGSEDAFIGALLHDVLEDGSPAYASEIREKFGETVLGIVEACSELRPEPGDHIPWLTRKTTYIAHLEALGEEGEPQAVVEGRFLWAPPTSGTTWNPSWKRSGRGATPSSRSSSRKSRTPRRRRNSRSGTTSRSSRSTKRRG